MSLIMSLTGPDLAQTLFLMVRTRARKLREEDEVDTAAIHDARDAAVKAKPTADHPKGELR